MNVLAIANEHAAYGRAVTTRSAGVLLALWAGLDRRNIVASWKEALPAATAAVAAAQLSVATQSVDYMDAALTAQDLDTTGPRANPAGFAGFAYPLDERDVPTTLDEKLLAPAYKTLSFIGGGVTLDRALAGGLENLMLRQQMQIADAARQAAGVIAATRNRPAGQVRMLNPPSCNRCVILAGKWYRSDAGFDRHPGCDCRGIPAKENDNSLTTDPYEYFESLSEADQDRYFTRAGAQAVRDGADIFQVVNARSGMYTTAGGSKVTREGTTRRGFWGRRQDKFERKNTGDRLKRSVNYRMMPEEIYKRNKGNRTRQLALLEEHGYIVGNQNPEGNIRGPGAGFLAGVDRGFSVTP